jgi:hypothetical protein
MMRLNHLSRFALYALLPGAAALVPVLAPAASPAARAPAPATGDVKSWVDARVESVQPSAAERRFDEIGWLTDIRAALALAKKNDRPVFLFTHDGRMALGRC